MKWIVLIVVIVVLISFYVIIKRQNDFNKEEAERNKILNNVANFGNVNIKNISEQKVSIVDRALSSPIVSGVIGIFKFIL